ALGEKLLASLVYRLRIKVMIGGQGVNMTRAVLLVAVLATPLSLFAQNQPASSAPPQSTMVEVPATNIYVVGGGLYGSGVYVMPPPAAGAVASEATTGISLAGRAGISLNTPVDLGVQSTLTPSNPTINYGSTPSAYSASAPAAAESAESSERVKDLLPASFVDSGTSASAAPSLSLAEIAAQYRANRPRSVRTFNNADAEKLTNKVSIIGVTNTGTERRQRLNPR